MSSIAGVRRHPSLRVRQRTTPIAGFARSLTAYRGDVPERLENEPARVMAGARGRNPRRVAGGVSRLPWRRIINTIPPVELLSADQVETIHRAALTILRDVGVQVLGARALDRFAAAGARIDREDGARGRRDGSH